MTRLIEKPAARAQLLAAIAASPSGEKLHIPRLRDALVSQADVIAGIERLIADGLLDSATLRPPVKPAKLTAPAKSALLPAGQALATMLVAEATRRGLSRTGASLEIFGNRSQLSMLRHNTARPVQQKTFDRARAWLDRPAAPKRPSTAEFMRTNRAAPPEAADPGVQLAPPAAVPRPVSGNDLADAIEAVLAQHPAASRTEFGQQLNGCRSGIDKLRKSKVVRPETIAKAKALMACPPGRRARSAAPRRDPTQRPDTPLMDLADRRRLNGARHSAAINRAREKTAADLLDKGVAPGSQNSQVAAQMRVIERRRIEEARLTDPVEVAKTALRARGRAVFDASVHGGRKGRFIVSGLRDDAGKALQLTAKELIAKARQVNPRAMEAVQERPSQ